MRISWIVASVGFAFAVLEHGALAQVGAEHSPVCHLGGGGPGGLLMGPGVAASRRPASSLLDAGVRDMEELGHGAPIEGDEVSHRVAFTFDDGPRFETTPRVLEALARYDVPATFFVVGWRFGTDRPVIEPHKGLLRDILAAGHTLGNHTFHHANLNEASTETMRAEIDDNSRAIIERVGYRVHAFRPPYGAMNGQAREHLEREGLTEVRWPVDSLDFWAGSMRTLRGRTMQGILDKRGGVVLMHDTKEATAANIAGILDDLEAENCRRLAAAGRGDGAAASVDPGGEVEDLEPIIPVSIHYFMRERDGSPRAVPAHVEARTRRYIDRLPERCAARRGEGRVVEGASVVAGPRPGSTE